LLEANPVDGSLGQTYADCISMAIVARLLASASGVALPSDRGEQACAWRLKRAIDYVEAASRAREPSDVAASAGLTRMHSRAVPGCHGFGHTSTSCAAGSSGSRDARRNRMSLVDVGSRSGSNPSHFTSVSTLRGQPPRAGVNPGRTDQTDHPCRSNGRSNRCQASTRLGFVGFDSCAVVRPLPPTAFRSRNRHRRSHPGGTGARP